MGAHHQLPLVLHPRAYAPSPHQIIFDITALVLCLTLQENHQYLSCTLISYCDINQAAQHNTYPQQTQS